MTKIKFHYTRMPVWVAAIDCEVDRNVTFCKVQIDGMLTSGNTIHNPHDNFNKRIARKIALQRALLGIDKETRTKVWTEYLTRHKV